MQYETYITLQHRNSVLLGNIFDLDVFVQCSVDVKETQGEEMGGDMCMSCQGGQGNLPPKYC